MIIPKPQPRMVLMVPPESQLPMVIEHPINGALIPQRPRDGYIDATRLCKEAGRLFADYYRSAQTTAFLNELSSDMGIPISGLVQSVRGGDPRLRGTWIHPQVAINLAQWLSPAFAVKVNKWVFDWMTGRTSSYMPEHVKRFLVNRRKIPHTHFSMLNEIYLNLFAALEDQGLVLPDKMMPDISTGRMFSDFLRQKGIEPGEFPTYEHEFAADGRPTVRARLYPIEHLADFRRYFNEVWLPQRAKAYFDERFPQALPLLSTITELPSTTGDQN